MDWLKLIRLACAILVVYSHAFSVSTGILTDEPLVAGTGHSLGSYAVLVFFIISGVVITISLERNQNLAGFFLRRVLRIWPALLVSIFLTAFVIGPLFSTTPIGAYFTDMQFIKYLVGASSLLSTSQPLPGLFSNLPDAGAVNVPLWTLKYEFLAYVSAAFLLVVLGFSKRSITALAISLLILNGVLRMVSFEIDPKLMHAVTFLGAFFAGSALMQARLGNAQLLAGAVLFSILLPFALGTAAWMSVLTCAIAMIILMIFQAQTASPRNSRLEFGDYSYGIYIFAFPLQQCTVQLFPMLSPQMAFLVSLAAVFPFAVLSWHLLEKRAIGFGKRISGVGSQKFNPANA